MKVIFRAIEDIKKDDFVELDFETGQLSINRENIPELQPREAANIIGRNDHVLL